MFKPLSIAAALLVASGAIAQSTPPGQTTPGVTPSDTPAVTPSQTPSVIPPTTPPVVGGMSRCQNMIGADRDKCLQEERSGTAGIGGRPAGAGGSHAPGSTGTGAGTMGPQNTAPAGSIR